jgi:Secretion system C-terminal sorting domain
MKRAIAFLLLLSSMCRAQNYQCLQPGVKQYFTNNYGYLRGMRIDSVNSMGTYTVYHPFHTPRGRYTRDTLDSAGGSWLGKNVIAKNDGTFYFDNIWHDTVVIRTQAHTGESWVFYNDTTRRYYLAKLIGEDTMTIAGSLDSVKTINIKAYDDTGFVPSDSVNRLIIKLSKNHGFYQAIDLYTFPYHPPDSGYLQNFDYFLDIVTNTGFNMSNSVFTQVAFINPTRTQLFDWNVGDVFEVGRCNIYYPGDCIYRYQYYFDSFTNKVVYPDSVQYSYTGWKATQHFNPFMYVYNAPYLYDTVSVNQTITIPNSLLFDTLYMPEEFKQTLLINYFPADSSDCITSAKYETNPSELSGARWYNIHFESGGPTNTYKTGLGLVHYFYYTIGNPSEEREDTTLLYYVRAGVPCGTYVVPPPATDVKDITEDNKITLAPNPALKQITITSFQTINSISINTLIGQNIYYKLYNTKSVAIDVADLPAGVYLLRINDTEVRKFIKE